MAEPVPIPVGERKLRDLTSMSNKRVNAGAGNRMAVAIRVPASGTGLHSDAVLLAEALRDTECDVRVLPTRGSATMLMHIRTSRLLCAAGVGYLIDGLLRLAIACRRLFRATVYDFQFHLEAIDIGVLHSAKVNILVPNPEWLLPEESWKLGLIDLVACKTRQAERVFQAAGLRTTYLGFVSLDRSAPSVRMNRAEWLHVASKGYQKGTDAILEAWRKHPEWPRLSVLCGRQLRLGELARRIPNVRVIDQWLSDDDLRQLMQSSGVHVCASRAEGFGHTIVEAMGCGALVVGTDVEPINEYLTEQRGVLIRVAKQCRLHWGVEAHVTVEEIEYAVKRAIELSPADYDERRDAAKAWFERNRLEFPGRVKALVVSLQQAAAKG